MTITDTISIPFLVACATAIGAIVTKLLDAWHEKARVERVDVPEVQAQGWVEMFKIANETSHRLQADVAKLERRLDDQDEEHRVELAERASQYSELSDLQRETAGSLRRLRAYVVVVTGLLAERGIPFPPMPDEDVASERRTPTVTAQIVVEPKEP